MTTQEALEAVFQKIVENARAICVACNLERKGRSPLPVWAIHTCDATIDLAAEGMLAAVDSLQFLNIEGCGDCQDTAQFDAKATIHRLLKGESDALR